MGTKSNKLNYVWCKFKALYMLIWWGTWNSIFFLY